MNPDMTVPNYHVLLIGIDAYPPRYNSLTGCVNDIDAIEQILLDPPGIGIPSEQIRITRLAAANPRRPSSTRLQNRTLPPTRANLVHALKALAVPEVKPEDRVLIYYSGHGDQQQWPGSLVWHEALVPHNGQQIEYFFDVQVNALINAIATRTSDLTIVLDCCHSAGATRDLSDIGSLGADRHLVGDPGPIEPPDPAALGLSEEFFSSGLGSTRILQSTDPNYLVVVACQPDEKAGEGVYRGEERSHGILTYSLLGLLQHRSADERAKLRWADLWPQLLMKVSERCTQLGRKAQIPWYIGRTERHIFGGPWELQDIGYPIIRLPDGRYRIGSGTLMGVTQNAEVAVYGHTPPLFPPTDSPDNQPVGRLQVVEAGRDTCIAISVGTAFDLPYGARGRLVKPGESEQLCVVLKPEDANLAAELRQSALLQIEPTDTVAAHIEVISESDGGWIIGNDVEPVLARIPPMETAALRAGIESYYRYHTVLRLAKNCNDPQLSRCLTIRLLDCTDAKLLQAMTQEDLADPHLPEVSHDEQGIYHIKPGSRSCVKVSNASKETLKVTLLNCSAGGLVEYMADAILRNDSSHVIWFKSELGRGFLVSPDKLPLPQDVASVLPFVTDRLIAIGTTRRDVDLNYLRVDKTVQQIVDENLERRGMRSMLGDAERNSNSPVELWTATITPLRIDRE